MYKSFIFSVCLSLLSLCLTAQVPKYTCNINAELTSKYVWRGQEYGTSPTLFSSLQFQYQHINAALIGGYALNGSHQEVDICIGYQYKNIYIGLSDYYYPSAVGKTDNYWDVSKLTGHYGELYAMYQPTRLPLQLLLSTYVYGADKNNKQQNAYSTYAEANYTFTIGNTQQLTLGCGTALNKGLYTKYTDAPRVVNTFVCYQNKLSIKQKQIPVTCAFIYNPYINKSFITSSIKLSL